MQTEITQGQRLLDSSGNIRNPGYAKKMVWDYRRSDIRVPRWRLKEWDYYYIGCDRYGLALTVSNAGFASLLSVSFMNFDGRPSFRNDTEIRIPPSRSLILPESSEEGTISYRGDRAEILFENDGKSRHLRGIFNKFDGGPALTYDLCLTGIPEESMVIATPFRKQGHFYYNQKINCMRVDGVVKLGMRRYPFRSDEGAMATLDWGRGVWTYDNTWYWGSGQMLLEDGSPFGWNIGYGFGDCSMATENMLFFRGKAHKLKNVRFEIPKNQDGSFSYMEPWLFTEDDGRFEMKMIPLLDRTAPLDLKLISMVPHQVFGLYSGKAILDDGTEIRIKDRIAFAEHVRNKW